MPRLTAPLFRRLAAVAALALLPGLAACGPDYSPNTYSANAVQQANKVDKGVIIGVRAVDVTSAGVVGAAAGAAAGGALGAQTPGSGVTSTLGAIGGGLVGGLIGTSVEHSVEDTTAYEYIVRKSNNELVSVTQKDTAALAIGMHVLVIAGAQARIVRDYTVDPEPPAATLAPPAAPKPAAADTPAAAPTSLAPPPPASPTEPAPAPVSETPLVSQSTATAAAAAAAAKTSPAAAGAAIGAAIVNPAATTPPTNVTP